MIEYNNYSVQKLTAFKLPIKVRHFYKIKSITDASKLGDKIDGEKIFVIGNGTNTFFTHDFQGTILKVDIKGIKIVKETMQTAIVDVGAGENWHKLVMYTVKKGWSGVENLALIPGTVGAAPVQNIAAYGQNFADSAVSVTGFNLKTKKLQTIEAKHCKFYYRDSIFKHEFKNNFIITSVRMKFFKTAHFDTNYYGSKPYESLMTEILKINPGYPNTPLTPEIIANAVINQRMVKMPNWKILGTAGSFFKNPFVTKEKFNKLKKQVPDLQAYPVDKMLYPNPDDPVFKMSNKVKIPAGKLLDELGWRGKRVGNVGTFERHALIVVSYKGATAKEILKFKNKMKESVYKKYNVKIEEEVNII